MREKKSFRYVAGAFALWLMAMSLPLIERYRTGTLAYTPVTMLLLIAAVVFNLLLMMTYNFKLGHGLLLTLGFGGMFLILRVISIGGQLDWNQELGWLVTGLALYNLYHFMVRRGRGVAN